MSFEFRRWPAGVAAAAALSCALAAAPAWSRDRPSHALLQQAAFAQHRHEFASALRMLTQLLASDPHNDQAWLMRAAILQVQGDYAASRAACRLLGNRVTRLVRTACLAAATGGSADSVSAARELESVIQLPPVDPPQVRAWAFGILGERHMLAGNTQRAEAALRDGLEALPGDVYLAAALADLLLDRGNAAGALALLPAEAIPFELQLRRGRALVTLGRGESEHVALAAELERIERREGHTHGRSEAYFLLHVRQDPIAALPVAEANFRNQREPIDRSLLLAAAGAAGRREAAAPVHAWMAANEFP